MADVDKGSIGQLVQVRDSSSALIHEVVQGKARAHALGSVELVLTMSIFLAQFSSTSGKLDKPQQTLVHLIFQTLEPRIVRVWVVRRQLVHVTHKHVVRNMGMVLV